MLKYLKLFEQFLHLTENKPKGAPDFHHSDAPDAEGRFKDLSIKDLAAWLIKTRKKDVKKISGSLTQQIVFNRKSDPKYAEKMEKTRKEVYKQLGREDLLKEALLEKGYNMDDIHDLIAFHRFNKDFRKLSAKDKEWVENDAKERGFNESANVESDLHKIYAAVNTDTGHEWAKEEGSKAYKVITPKDISKLELDPSIPILNYNMAVTEDLVKKFPKMKNFIYNPNETIQVSNSKKDFHERLGDDSNIPKTAYNEKDALKIGFPLIAKPKTGHSGKGIKIFKDKDEFLKEDKSKYDLFSQFIDKKSEHRIINFKGKPMVWMERTPLNEKAKKGDGDASEEMRFKYLKKDPLGLPKNFAKTNKAFCEKFKEIPLICFDIMEDQKGHVYIIESNTMTGMPFNISLELYEKLFEDYYKRPMSNESKNEMKLLSEGLIKRTLSRDSDTKWGIES